MVADLRPTGAQLLWIVDSYVFLVAGSLLAMGAIGDRIGRRRLLLIGATMFSVASVFGALAGSVNGQGHALGRYRARFRGDPRAAVRRRTRDEFHDPLPRERGRVFL